VVAGRVLGSGICEGDLVFARWTPPSEQGVRFGHEFVGVVEDVGSDVAGLSAGDLVVAPPWRRRSGWCATTV
jgi:threonine dehydrogenase-like Zn-dependent dehydrogenase